MRRKTKISKKVLFILMTLVTVGLFSAGNRVSAFSEKEKTEQAYNKVLGCATGHVYELEKREESTCETEGSELFVCGVCGGTYQEIIEKLGHNYVETERVEPTTTSDGYVKHTCENCGDVKTEVLPMIDIDKEYTIDLGNGQTTTVRGHFIEDGMAQEIVDLVNMKREYIADLHGSKYVPLKLAESGSKLDEVAKTRAVEITYKYSHQRPNGELSIASFRPGVMTAAENIAIGQESAMEVFRDWETSTDHNAAMINPAYPNIGLAIFAREVEDGVYINHFVQMFSYTM